MINKVFFIGDYYRGDQNRNIENLYTLLSPIFVDMNITTSLLNDLHKKEIQIKWESTLLQEGISILSEYDLTSSLIIAFEMNPLDKVYLDVNKIPWIDIEIHPIRFLDDLYFSIQTSLDYDFTKNSVSKNYIQFTANILKSEYKNNDYNISSNSLLIIGQTPIDKSVYYDKRFKTLVDYTERLDEISLKYEHIYYRPHPYLTNEKVDKEIMSRYNASLLTDESYYELLSSDELSAVCGISSSSLHEAEYFFKDIFFLENRRKKYLEPIALKSFMENYKFWEEILSMSFLKNKLIFNIPENTCRKFYGYWSYIPKSIKNEAIINSKINDMIINIDEAKNVAKELQMKVHELEAKVLETQVKTIESEAKVNEALNLYNIVVNSNSWKITKPLRLAGKGVRWFVNGSKAWLTFSETSRPRRVLKKVLLLSKHKINRNPKLKNTIMNMLDRFPSIKQRLKKVGQSQCQNSTVKHKLHKKNLSPNAQKVYDDITKKLQQNQKGI